MKKLIQCLWATLFFFVAVGTAEALVVNFDDLSVPAAPGYMDVPASYAGFSWTDFEVLTQPFYQTAYANTYSFPSQANAAFNGDGSLSVSLQSGTDFDFQGAYFSAFAQSNDFQPWSAAAVTVYGFNDGNPVGSAALNLSSTGFVWLQADLLGVDQLLIQSDGVERWWLMDDFTYQPIVPEPTTLFMLAGGLVGLAGYNSRRKILKK